MAGTLSDYQRKRTFGKTPEPRGTRQDSRHDAGELSFVVQQHDARRMHYDFRLELDGVLKSWAIPKGPSLDSSVKRLAVHVEDHPLDYADFEGRIPEGNYGAGQVIVWDRGTWTPHGDARKGYASGKLEFDLHGSKLGGTWVLVRSRLPAAGGKEQWLLIKERDDAARESATYDVTKARPESAKSGETIGEAQRHSAALWRSRARDSVPAVRRTRPPTRAARGDDSGNTHEAATPGPIATHGDAGHFRLESAPRVPLPQKLSPQLATLIDAPPAGNDWLYEIKFDGYRLLARIEARKGKAAVKLFTRNGLDWTSKFPRQAKALAMLDVGDAWLDGEAVVLDDNGVPSFQALQNAFETARHEAIVLYLFDAPVLHGRDLRTVALEERRALLREVMGRHAEDALRFSEDFGVSVHDLLRTACDMSLEGIIGKRRDAPYVEGRSATWVKLKCRKRQEFVIGGYTDPRGSRKGFGALLLGVTGEDGQLHYAGRVGSGFDGQTLDSLMKTFARHASDLSPFTDPPPGQRGAELHWLKPVLVAEVNFSEWTADGLLRQASFVALRSDKPARAIVREHAIEGGEAMNARMDPTDGRERAAKAVPKISARKRVSTKGSSIGPTNSHADTVAGIRITHAERLIDKTSGTRKIDLARYYESVAPWSLPHLADRPVALVRAPQGLDRDGELFFQKHVARLVIPGVRLLDPALDPGHAALMAIESVTALVGSAQMDMVELHTWNAVARAIEKPDRMVFDLDPDPSLPWERMIEAAQLIHALLDELGLASFCKTSGGKGLHIVVPLVRQLGWDDVKDFSQAVAHHLAATLPDHFSAKMGPKNRIDKIFIDYLRNGRGASTVAAFSARARPGMGVSMPIDWAELDTLETADQWHIGNVGERLAALRRDPWADYAATRQRITVAMRKRLAG